MLRCRVVSVLFHAAANLITRLPTFGYTTRWDSCWQDVRPVHEKLSRSHESKSMNRGEICRQILVQQLPGIWFSLRSGGRNNSNNNNLADSCIYICIRRYGNEHTSIYSIAIVSLCRLPRENGIHLILFFSSLPVCLLARMGKNTDGLSRKANNISTCTGEEPSAHLFPPTYSPVGLFSSERGVKYFLARREGFSMTSVCHNSRFLFFSFFSFFFFFFAFIVRELRGLRPRLVRRSAKDQYRTRSTRVGEGRAQRQKEFRVNSDVFEPPFLLLLLLLLLWFSCLSSCWWVIPFHYYSIKPEWIRCAISRGGMKSWYWKFLQLCYIHWSCPLGVWLPVNEDLF